MYVETESLFGNIHVCDNNPQASYTTKINKQSVYGYLLITHCPFDTGKSKHDFCRGADCIKKFCADLRKYATEIMNYQEKERLPLTDKGIESYHNKKFCQISKMKFHDVNDSHDSDDNRNDSNDNSDNKKFSDEGYDNYGDEKFNGMRFHSVSKNYERVCDHCHYADKCKETAHSIRNLIYKTPKEILLVFYNESSYDCLKGNLNVLEKTLRNT